MLDDDLIVVLKSVAERESLVTMMLMSVIEAGGRGSYVCLARSLDEGDDR